MAVPAILAVCATVGATVRTRLGASTAVLACAALSFSALLGPGSAWAQTGYEEQTGLRASQLLPPELLSGPHHRVEEAVGSDGMGRIYTVTSEFGTYQARGEARLRQRIAEIEAMAVLKKARGSEAYRQAAGRAGTPPSAGTPVAVPGLPVGVRPARPAAGPGGRALDLDATRRQIAAQLGVDPYTANPSLRSELEGHAWVAVAGGMASSLVSHSAEPEAAPDSSQEAPRVSQLLRDWSADDLVRLNRIELVAMGVEEPLREEFLSHPSYSPHTGTVLVDALSSLEGTDDRSAFIEAAVEAESEDEAHEFRRMAELIRGYGERTGGLEKITTVDGRVAAFAADGTLVVPVLADHTLWTRRVAQFTESMAKASGSDPEVARTHFLVSGRVSPRARTEMQGRGIEVIEGDTGGEAAQSPRQAP